MKYVPLPNASIIRRDNDDGTTSFIPRDEGNVDYQAYLASITSERKSKPKPKVAIAVKPKGKPKKAKKNAR